jgi:hypothetical protein
MLTSLARGSVLGIEELMPSLLEVVAMELHQVWSRRTS